MITIPNERFFMQARTYYEFISIISVEKNSIPRCNEPHEWRMIRFICIELEKKIGKLRFGWNHVYDFLFYSCSESIFSQFCIELKSNPTKKNVPLFTEI